MYLLLRFSAKLILYAHYCIMPIGKGLYPNTDIFEHSIIIQWY